MKSTSTYLYFSWAIMWSPNVHSLHRLHRIQKIQRFATMTINIFKDITLLLFQYVFVSERIIHDKFE